MVDDNQSIIDVFSYYCNNQGIEFEAINDSKDALPIIRKNEFDLLLLDLAMPNISGLDIINALVDEKLIERMNVVLFTASPDTKLLEQVKNLGVKEIVQKPCGIEVLEDLVKRYNSKIAK